MKKVSVKKFVDGVNSIYAEKPKYVEGGDGSGGECDCIGMVRGGLKRAGATDIKNLHGTNQAARKAIRQLGRIEYVKNLRVGDVVLKTRSKDDPSMPLPDRYRKDGADYDPAVGETNFTHIGTITCMDPIEITHMTSPTAKKDKSIKGWPYSGKLPWVDYDPDPEPTPEPEPEPEYATVYAENGKPVKMRAKPSTSCSLYWEVPNGAEVRVYEWDDSTDSNGVTWSRIQWAGQDGYMMKKFLRAEDDNGGSWTVTISGLTFEQAEQLCRDWSDASMKRG